MTIHEFLQQTECALLCGSEAALEKQITGGYCGDLLSWVMSRANAGDAWFTVMGNVNAVGVAALAEVACIVLVENAVLDEDARRRAEQNDVCILQGAQNAYTLAGVLHDMLS